MTILKYASAATIVALTFGIMAAILPFSAGATNAVPRCVLNTIVQPFNNGGTTLSWKVYDAQTISINGGVGIVSDADSIVVYPSVATTYTLTATSNGGVDTCTALVQPTSAYPYVNNRYGYHNANTTYKCEAQISPDLVVPGGTAVLSWDTGSAPFVSISNGIGNVGKSGTRVVPNTGIPQTFTVNARWTNGTTRTCSATVRPTGPIAAPTYIGGVNIPPTFLPVSRYSQVVQAPAQTYPAYPAVITAPVVVPQVTASYTPSTVAYVSLNQVPYTGSDDTMYVLGLLGVLLVSLGGAVVLYRAKLRLLMQTHAAA